MVRIGSLGPVSNSHDTLSGLQWHEPVEGLEFGELLLGTVQAPTLHADALPVTASVSLIGELSDSG